MKKKVAININRDPFLYILTVNKTHDHVNHHRSYSYIHY
jgi:hypothetical protein